MAHQIVSHASEGEKGYMPITTRNATFYVGYL